MLSENEALFVKKVIGFRNIVVHEYFGVDEGLVRKIIGDSEYRKVTVLATALIERALRKGLDP